MSEKKRSPNFTNSEKLHLFKLVVKYAHILGHKKNDKSTVLAKKRVWNRIHNEFNAVSPALVYRSTNTLKLLFENKKRDLRRKAVRIKMQAALGDSAMPEIEIDAIEEKLLRIIDDEFISLDNITSLYKGKQQQKNENNPIKLEVPSEENSVNMEETQEIPTEPEISNEEREFNTNASASEPFNMIFTRAPELHLPSQRNPEQSIGMSTFPDMELKYNVLLNKKLLIMDKRIELINMEKEHLKEESKLKLELLRLQIATARTKLMKSSF